MFNKPALFPKVADSQATRGARVGPGSLNPGSASGPSPRGPSESAALVSESPTTVADESLPKTATEPIAVGQDAVRETGSCLIVGPDVKLKGAEILDCDTLVVEGRVEATMDSRVIRIAENGSFAGTVGIDVAEVHGRFDGELTARSQLVIHATGRVSGKIRYGKILIEEGGEISGDVQSLATAKEVGRDAMRAVSRDEPPAKVAMGA